MIKKYLEYWKMLLIEIININISYLRSNFNLEFLLIDININLTAVVASFCAQNNREIL